ncbi:nesprin-2 [Chanos chanos]|uniref:Nesprin-2 n=1 Tax=Chanos chanos TaxID=29144 RepID=A0A6J2VPK1_CHACN|nr:nesprin-2-like [Chanos chanos]
MPGETLCPGSRHGDDWICTAGSVEEEEEEEEERPESRVHLHGQCGLSLYLNPAESPVSECDSSSLSDMNEALQDWTSAAHPAQDWTSAADPAQDWTSAADPAQDGALSLEACIQLEKRWMLWHEFMKEYSCFDDWLRLAEKVAATPNSSHVLYATAKEELRKFETLQAETRSRLAQLDKLVQRSRSLVSLFKGTMRSRLVATTRDCGQRWDQLSRTVESICRRLKHFVSLREDFERQREEMAVWLADMNLRLTEVEHFSGRDACAKMQQLQSFQELVGENTARLNALLEQGEELIQRSEPGDAQAIEGQLQELLVYCADVFEGVGRLHTRLLSMRLVFEEDWLLYPPSDSGCPSETLLEEDNVFDKASVTEPETSRAQPIQEHLVLEWDPSVDIGGSVSHDDEDSSYFSAVAGVYNQEEALGKRSLKRRVCLQGLESRLEDEAPPQALVPGVTSNSPLHSALWRSSTPDRNFSETVNFDPERISAWLGQTDRHTEANPDQNPCSKAVQTEPNSQGSSGSEHGGRIRENVLSQRHPCPRLTAHSSTSSKPASSCDSEPCSDWRIHRCLSDPQGLEEVPRHCSQSEDGTLIQKHCISEGEEAAQADWWSYGTSRPRSHGLAGILWAPKLFYILLVILLLAVVICLPSAFSKSECHHANTLARSFHLALRYVNGPPPT